MASFEPKRVAQIDRNQWHKSNRNTHKIINIEDIQQIDVAKHNYLPFTYKPTDSEELIHERLFLNDIQIRFMQESFTRKIAILK